jgi:two-component system, OmpR family, copper resistance phosphate regulon response regulator CusR
MRVLVVEDQAELADDIADGLRDQGIGADVAYDGSAGIEKALMNSYDVVVLDRDLPEVHGDAVCATLIGSRSAARILMLTAAATVGDRVQGLNLGADDYLCKPFAFDELLARARALIRRGRPLEVMALSYRDVRVDLAAQKAERAGHPLNLTSKELAVLVFFLRHPDQVLSRTRIYGIVWGEDYDFVSNTLDVHIKELRRALEAQGPRLIHTVRGRGYLLGDPPAPADKEAP